MLSAVKYSAMSNPEPDAPEEVETPKPPSDSEASGRNSKFAPIPLILCIAGMLISPFFVATFVPEAAAGWTVLGIFFVLALGTGVWFGAITKPTWWFPVAVGVAFMLTRALYFQDGLFLYALGFAALAGVGTLLSGAGKLELDDDDASAVDKFKEVEHGEVGA
ncbi:MAG TPA: hypothetical protein GXZ83_07275 [Corynebacterium stationis]|nr:hypothetical protein [Corynebacterium stationis]